MYGKEGSLMPNILIPWLMIAGGLLVIFVYILVMALLQTVKRLTETNKQLLILVAGLGGKPEVTGSVLRALVASEKPPQGKLRGIAKKDKKSVSSNTDYEMTVGVL